MVEPYLEGLQDLVALDVDVYKRQLLHAPREVANVSTQMLARTDFSFIYPRFCYDFGLPNKYLRVRRA